MKIVPYQKRLGPDLDTTHGTYTSPYIGYDPTTYRYQRPAADLLIRGTHSYRVQPRVLGPSAYYQIPPVQASSSIGALPSALSSGWGLILLLLGVGVVGCLIGSALSKTSRRTVSNPERSGPRKHSKRLRQYARGRRRDAHGRFI